MNGMGGGLVTHVSSIMWISTLAKRECILGEEKFGLKQMERIWNNHWG